MLSSIFQLRELKMRTKEFYLFVVIAAMASAARSQSSFEPIQDYELAGTASADLIEPKPRVGTRHLPGPPLPGKGCLSRIEYDRFLVDYSQELLGAGINIQSFEPYSEAATLRIPESQVDIYKSLGDLERNLQLMSDANRCTGNSGVVKLFLGPGGELKATYSPDSGFEWIENLEPVSK
jgi:hypothetical protein